MKKLINVFFEQENGTNPNSGSSDNASQRTPARYETQLPKEFQNDDFKDIDSLDKLYTGYRKLEKESKGTIKLINKDSTSEEVASFYKALGRPDKAEDYGLLDYDLDPSSLEKTKAKFQEEAFNNGLSKDQAKAMWRTFIASKEADITEKEEERKKSIETYPYRLDNRLREEYPDDAKRSERIKLEENLYKEFVAESGLGTFFADTGLTTNTDFMHKLAKFFENHQRITITPSGQKPTQDVLAQRYTSMT